MLFTIIKNKKKISCSKLRKLALSGGQNSLANKNSKDNVNIPFRHPVVQGRLDPIKHPSHKEFNEMRFHI